MSHHRIHPRWSLGALLVALACLSTFALPSAALAADITPSAAVRTNVVVRSAPTTGAPPLEALRPGDRAELLEVLPRHYRVRLPNGTTGYVSRRWTVRVPDVEAALLEQPNLTLHFIDVGQGDSTLVQCPNGAAILIDSGSLSGASPDEIGRYIREQIAASGGDIDHLIVSHPDRDHYNLLPRMLQNVEIGRAWYVGSASDYNLPGAFAWLTSAPRQSTRLTEGAHDPQSTPNAAIDCGAADVWILAAAVEATASPSNARSIVVMIRMGDFEAMITGDATHATENVILSRYSAQWLDIDVLRVGHHGSLATSTSVRWADTLSPTMAIFSAGRTNSFGHPRAEVVARLLPHARPAPAHGFRDARQSPPGQRGYVFTDHNDMRRAIYATASSGTIVVRSDGRGYTVTTER